MSATSVVGPATGPAVRGPAGPELRIDPAAIAENVRRVRAATVTPVLAVVKADGFGCGAAAVARAALGGGARWLGTATIDEAVALRRKGIAAPLLCWLTAPDADWEAAVRWRIDIAVASVQHLRRLAQAARALRATARVHLHADVGLARDGAPEAEWPRLVAEAATQERLRLVEVVGVMGHLPDPDEPRGPANDAGVERFASAVGIAHDAGLHPATRHLAATATALQRDDARFDLVRIGAGLYGIGAGLRPAARWTAPVVLTRAVSAGTAVGYGHTARVERDTVLALLPVGYADGVPRRLDGPAAASIAGRRCPIVGRVSMDSIVVDAGPDGVELGASATLFGSGEEGEPTLADWARWAGTVEQDVLSGIGARVRRTTGPAR